MHRNVLDMKSKHLPVNVSSPSDLARVVKLGMRRFAIDCKSAAAEDHDRSGGGVTMLLASPGGSFEPPRLEYPPKYRTMARRS